MAAPEGMTARGGTMIRREAALVARLFMIFVADERIGGRGIGVLSQQLPTPTRYRQGRWILISLFNSMTRAAICGISRRSDHRSQQATAWGKGRNWLASASWHEVLSAARWLFHALMWFSAWPRANRGDQRGQGAQR